MHYLDRWLLPEGIEEILPPKAMQLEKLCRSTIDVIATWGYELVIPPMMEYLESLLTGTGKDLDIQTFKIIDQLSGRLMGLRADMTPQIARIDAHLLKRDIPARLCYLGSILHARTEKSGDTRQPLQLGAELYGHAGVASDIEIVKLMLATLQYAGIQNIYLDINHSAIFRELSTALSLNKTQKEQVLSLLQRKAKNELECLLQKWHISGADCQVLLDLIDLNGDKSVLADASQCLANATIDITKYIEEVSALIGAIENTSGLVINIDLADIRGYHYHTGMVYTAFVEGVGEGIAFGGRYDDIGSAFGRARPATGFSTDMKLLLRLQRTAKTTMEKIYAPAKEDARLQKKINLLRELGKIVIQNFPDQLVTAKNLGCNQQLILKNDEWVVTKI